MTERASDRQVGGDHYIKHSVQPWDLYTDWLGREGFIGFLRGTVLKYVIRYRDKGGIQDLEKAAHYLQKLIEEEKKCPPTAL